MPTVTRPPGFDLCRYRRRPWGLLPSLRLPLRVRVGGLLRRRSEHFGLHKDRRAAHEGKGNGIAGPGVYVLHPLRPIDDGDCIERALRQPADADLSQPRAGGIKNAGRKVERERPGHRHLLQLHGNRGALELADPNRQSPPTTHLLHE